MLDLHCHLLPAIDDGAKDLNTALEMARMAVADGIRTVACTPHIYPGMYENDAGGIRAAIARMRSALEAEGIDLELVEGADVHLDTDLVGAIRENRVPTLAGSRYLLLEPPHHVAPPGLEQQVFSLMAAGIVPVITHPERLSWIEQHYDVFMRLVERGVWMQVTAGALTGRHGRRPRYWAERMLAEGKVHLLATDAHDTRRRPPLLAEAREAASAAVGPEESRCLVETRPAGIIANKPAADMPPLPEAKITGSRRSFWHRLRGAA
jgi:protein-tyrosine phosphatase